MDWPKDEIRIDIKPTIIKHSSLHVVGKQTLINNAR